MFHYNLRPKLTSSIGGCVFNLWLESLIISEIIETNILSQIVHMYSLGVGWGPVSAMRYFIYS